jgi:hypothetical protein
LAPELESFHGDACNFGKAVRWPQLRSLVMQAVKGPPLLGNQEVRTLARHHRLERLNIRCVRLTAAAIQALAGLSRLRELTLRFEDGPVPALKGLARAPALESLSIEGPITDDDLRAIATRSSLRTLSLSPVAVDGRGLSALAGLSGLEELCLCGQVEDAAALPALAALPHLERLDVQGLTMPPQATDAVKAACPPWVECLLPAAPQDRDSPASAISPPDGVP